MYQCPELPYVHILLYFLIFLSICLLPFVLAAHWLSLVSVVILGFHEFSKLKADSRY